MWTGHVQILHYNGSQTDRDQPMRPAHVYTAPIQIPSSLHY